jgi:trehalose-6-phosphate synthase
MPSEERRARMARLRHLASSRDIVWWRDEFLGDFLTGRAPGEWREVSA